MRGGIRLYFYPRPPRGGRLLRLDQTIDQQAISIHALREEGDQNSTTKPVCLKIFLSTPSARRATPTGPRKNVESKISIHALREEGDPRLYRGTADAGDFYPRPPRGGRLEQQAAMSYNSAISIHALREEGDARTRAIMCLTFTFLSTPSARRATTAYQRQTCSDTDFYPRPPRGGRPLALSLEPCDQLISIHALREEGDYHNRADDCRAGQFLSTPSARRATPCPCTPLCSQNKFLSTPSARRATAHTA